MTRLSRLSPFVSAVLLSFALAACGGSSKQASIICGGDSSSRPAPILSAAEISELLSKELNAPQVTGNMATDGFNWFNFRRKQIMGPMFDLTRNGFIYTAAQGHSNYQAVNDVITHDQIPGNLNFTGAFLNDDFSNNDPLKRTGRLSQAGYNLVPGDVMGEVISRTSNIFGFTAADALIAAIYHRFVIFEPMFMEAGAGNARSSSNSTYFTTDFVGTTKYSRLASGKVVKYPHDNQQQVPTSFDHSTEEPDPFPEEQCKGVIVGYPISIHANFTSAIVVTSFTLRQSTTGQDVPVRQLNHITDPGTFDEPRTPPSVAAIIPLAPLVTATSYTVQFAGSVDNQPVKLEWSFTTR